MSSKFVLSIDQGTTSTRAILFNQNLQIEAQEQKELTQFFPENGWVEHDPDEIWQDTKLVCKNLISKAKITPEEIASIGITNQRETTIIWNKETNQVLHNAIVWQDRRTSSLCQSLKDQGFEPLIQKKTGLLLDPYFSATKIRWILDHVNDAKKLANEEKLAFGTVESFLVWRLTGGKQHITDITNASRTLLFNIHNQEWDQELLKIFDIPETLLPRVVNNSGELGLTDASLFGKQIPICGLAGDQQSASIGQGCLEKGMVKSTYGTGCFLLCNTGEKAILSKNRLLTTVAYKIDDQCSYALEGSIFIAGAVIQWLRDNLHFFKHAKETEGLIKKSNDNSNVIFVPALTGLGAPYWDPEARGAIFGLTRSTTIADITKAAIEAVCFQTRDLVQAISDEDNITIKKLRVDGGMVANEWMLQFLSNILQIPVDRSRILETTALGVAMLAGSKVGFYSDMRTLANKADIDMYLSPKMNPKTAVDQYEGWLQAINKVKTI